MGGLCYGSELGSPAATCMHRNTTHPTCPICFSLRLQVDDTPVPAAALAGYELVFDAVYTPLHTRLLR